MELQFVLALFLLGTVSSSDVKSSLTFVIDATSSMSDDVKEVSNAVDGILDAVSNSSSSPVGEFVLVTFENEPKLVTKTKDASAFKKELGNVNTGGGGFCPEKTLTGIELALNESQDGSLLYVFTDASAEDYKNFAKVEALSQKKGVQIVFILTGVCQNDTFSQNYLVFHDIAKATNGQVFHLKKNEIGEILKYVKENVGSRKNVLLSKSLPARQLAAFNVKVDEDVKDLVIAVSGEGARLGVTDPSGEEAPTANITSLPTITIVKVPDVKSGVYRVQTGSISNTQVVVTASSSVHLRHGFSTIAPSSIEDTVTRPAPDAKSHIAVKVLNPAYVKLVNVQILGMDDTVLQQEPLTLAKKDEQFYTTEAVETPKDTFKLAINGYDTRKNINITRYSLTPIKPQSVIDQPTEKVPEVTIEGGPTINAAFFKPLTLKCKVKGYPKVDIIWQSDDASATLEYEKASIVELPYDYVSVLEIPKVEKKQTFSCQATNAAGDGVQNVTVLTEVKDFIEVKAEDTTIEYQKPGNITCEVLAHPTATVTWYKGRKLLKPGSNYNISADGTVITVNSMEPSLAGNYFCVAKNSVKKVAKLLKVDISGVGPPKIEKTIHTVHARADTPVAFRCRLLEAIPEATLSWSFKNANEHTTLNETSDTLHLGYVQVTDAGTYSCKAQNAMGVDYHGIELVVEYSPDISQETDTRKTVLEGTPVTLDCAADGIPEPSIVWTHNGRRLSDKTRHTFYANGSLGFSAVLSDAGYYSCQASNTWGSDSITIELDVIVPVALKSPGKTLIEQEEGTSLNLECKAGGPPQPHITWYYRKTNTSDAIKISHNTAEGDLRFPRIHHGQSGEYTCVAVNAGGSKNITYTVSVTARPSILFRMRQYDGVKDDMFLRVPCDATGNPKPEVLWTFGGKNLSSDTQWYLIGKDGSLIIKKVDDSAAGTYTCTAINKFGSTSEQFQVVVNDYPVDRFLSIMIEEGKTENIACPVPHRPKIDRVNWFKDGRNITSGELKNVTQEDAGTYTCRVSGPDRPPQTGSTRVEVGFKPRFNNEGENNIPYVYGRRATMDCSASGTPQPIVTWHHDGQVLSVTQFAYEFQMNNDGQRGRYTCAVTNQYGYVQKDFVVA
ncbi:hemicentin-2-like isoform X1 [Leguminivora glycinivorella]|uniref:hemicentin-2-like isoform X1 n=1 Tax=Leguminivora glycinivorella TaxID=1035111 RepID=UPI00200F8A4F|nr:hemicentin-2-like isoform X1 [Leguminivora glycinivorella]